MPLLIDGDIIAYRAAFSTEDETPEDAEEKVDELLGYLLEDLTFDGRPREVFLTGSGNFRYDIAVSFEYKGNRRDTAKPEHLDHIRDYMVQHWDAVVSSGEEADDLIAIRATQTYPYGMIVSVDKDFDQVPGWHYNPRRRDMYWVDEKDGIKFFYTQVLTGDTADNIIGLRGIGPVKAGRILSEVETEQEMYKACIEAYAGDVDRVIENARLLWLRREENQIWQPPEL